MSWQSNREAWNHEGLCAREACKASLRQSWRHPTTNLYYCRPCRRLLEEAQATLVMDQVEHWTVVHVETEAVLSESVEAWNPLRARTQTGIAHGVDPAKLHATRYVNPYRRDV